jgi:mRNA-degrading endonuclease toxin of MazEF toxin-antitoxin module
MVDKITAVRRDRLRKRIGRISPTVLHQTEEALLRFIGFEAD